MKVREMVAKLNEFNPDADLQVVVRSQPQQYEVTYGDSEGSTKMNCETVSLMVDTPSERSPEEP